MPSAVIDVKAKTRAAITKLFEDDIELLEDRTNERTVGCRLAQYLEQVFEGQYKADADYNRHGRGMKMLDANRISVDIVVHERRRDNRNLLALELKKSGMPEAENRARLRKITDKARGETEQRYGYDHGLFLKFLRNSNGTNYARLSWFKNGIEDGAEVLYAQTSE